MENDFWKEKLNFYQRKNMTKKNGEKLDKESAIKEINHFNENHPEVRTEFSGDSSIENSSGITWEAFLSDEIKLRFYLQFQIKISFMQKIDGAFIKIADAKFPYNPFSEINELFENAEKYLSEYCAEKNAEKHLRLKQKILYEFIKALLKHKFESESAEKTIHHIEANDADFTLTLIKNGKEEKYALNEGNFREIIGSL